MKKTLLFATAIACLFAMDANAAINQYVSVKGNYSFMDNQHKAKETVTFAGQTDSYSEKISLDDNTWGASVAYGVKTGPIRTELELNWNDDADKNLEGDKVEVESNSVMLNAYYDIETGTKVTPYVGVGIGMAHNKVSAEDYNLSDNDFAWQVGVGTSVAITKSLDFDMGYRYKDNGSAKKTIKENGGVYSYSSKDRLDVTSHNVYAGFRYSF